MADPLITATMVFGSVHLEQRPVLTDKGFGYESRRVDRDSAGNITYVGPWVAPLCHVTFGAPEAPKRRSWWPF